MKNSKIHICDSRDQCLTITALGVTRLTLDEFFDMERVDYCIFYILKGKSELEISGIKYKVQAKDYLIAPPKAKVNFTPNKGKVELLAITFNGYAVDMYMHRCGIEGKNPIFKDKDGDTIKKIMLDIEKRSKLKSNRYCKITSNMYRLFSEILDNKLNIRKNQMHDPPSFYFLKALEYIDKHYREDISSKSIAEFLGINQSYFAKIFIDKMDITPKQYIILKRLEKASMLLEKKDVSINFIAKYVNYTSNASFSRAFKQNAQMTPSMYREEILKGLIKPYRPLDYLLVE